MEACSLVYQFISQWKKTTVCTWSYIQCSLPSSLCSVPFFWEGRDCIFWVKIVLGVTRQPCISLVWKHPRHAWCWHQHRQAGCVPIWSAALQKSCVIFKILFVVWSIQNCATVWPKDPFGNSPFTGVLKATGRVTDYINKFQKYKKNPNWTLRH